MRSSKKIAAWMLAAAMATGLLAGCGGSSGNETTAAASAAEGTTAASTATDKTGDYSDKVITYGLTTAWDTVNPYGSTSGSIYQNLSATSCMTALHLLRKQVPEYHRERLNHGNLLMMEKLQSFT